MDNKTFKKMLLGMAMASPLALINSGNVHASSVKTNVETNWHANSLATVQQELRNQNINPDYKITNAKYIVQAGDTLSQIAAATHINMYHIAAVNHIQNLNLIYVGQVLILNQGNEVAHNVAGNGSTTAASIGNTYTLRSTSQQPVLNYYGHTQAQGTTGTPNVQRTANVNSQGVPAAAKPAKTVIPSTPSATNNQNTKPTTPTGNTGVNTGSHAGNTTPSVSGSVNTGSHVAGNTSTNTGSTVTSNTQGSASQTGSSATQNNNSQKTPTVDSSSASQQAPAQSSSTQQPASSASHATAPSASSNTQQPASSASSASQPTGSSQAQGSVNTGSTATPNNSQKTPTIDSSSASSNTQQPAQSSSSQGSVSSSSQQTTTSSSSSQQPASSASSSTSSSSQSTASTNSSSQSSASQQAPAQSSSSQSSASSSSQQPASSASSSSQKTVDGYTLDNMPLSVFNDKKNLNAINNTFSGDAIENYFNNHIGKGNMTWDEAQQAQQNGTITSAILSWNGQMLPTQMSQDMAKNNGVMANAIYNWRGMLPVSYLNGDNQMTEINKQYGSLNGDTLNQAQSEKLTSYLNSLLETYPGAGNKGTNAKLQEIANERVEKMTAYNHDGWDSNDTSSEVLADLGNINNFQNKSMFDILANSADGMYLWMYRDGGQDSVSVEGQAWGHRDALKEYSNWAFSIKVLSNGEVILIGEGQ